MQRLSHVFTLALVGALVCASLLSAGVSRVAAQDDAFSDLGLPELDVNFTTTAFEGIPEELAAGRYLLTLTAAEDTDFGGGIAFVQPDGMSAREFLEALAGPPDVAGADASPELETEATPGGEDEEMGGAPPEFFFTSTYAGGIGAQSGQSAQVVLDLTPGEWIAWGDDPSASQEPVIVTVTGEMPTDLPEPESGATLTMAEYSIEVTEGELATGPQVVKVTNVGAQPHFLFIAQGPDSMTYEQVAAVLESEMTGTPAAVDFDPDADLIPVSFTGTQSMNTDIWISVDLEAGKYALLCFFPDIESGMPHAYEGMYNVIEVTE